MFSTQAAQIEALELNFIEASDKLLEEAQLECFKYWAKRFPKRRLSCIWGMGTHSYDAGRVDLFSLLDYERKQWAYWRPKYDELLAPFLAFQALLESCSSGFYEYPCISDILYNPTTKTIETGSRIIYL